jgi:hypothetical protein
LNIASAAAARSAIAHDVLEGLRPREVVPELLHEPLEAGIERLAPAVLLDHARERVHHLTHPRQLLGVGLGEELLALLEVRVQDVLLEFADELLELLARL